MTLETQHTLAFSLYVCFIACILVSLVVSIVKVLLTMVDRPYSFKRSLMIFAIPFIISVFTFLLIYGTDTYESIDKSLDNRGDIRFSISDDGITIWARKPNKSKATTPVRESLR